MAYAIDTNDTLTSFAVDIFDSIIESVGRKSFASFPDQIKELDLNVICQFSLDDTIIWFESIFVGKYPNSKFAGYKYRATKVLKEVLSAKTGKVMVTLKDIETGETIRRQAQNILKNAAYLINGKINPDPKTTIKSIASKKKLKKKLKKTLNF